MGHGRAVAHSSVPRPCAFFLAQGREASAPFPAALAFDLSHPFRHETAKWGTGAVARHSVPRPCTFFLAQGREASAPFPAALAFDLSRPFRHETAKWGTGAVARRSVPRPCTFFLVQGREPQERRGIQLLRFSSIRGPSLRGFTACSPHLRFHFYDSVFPKRPCPKARPWPEFWRAAKAALHGVAVYIAQLSDEPCVISHVVIKIAGLPERKSSCAPLAKLPSLYRNSGFQHLHGIRESTNAWFADKQVNVLRHHDVPKHNHLEPAPDLFEGQEKCGLHLQIAKERLTMIATESQEVRLTGVMQSIESVWHGELSR